MGKIDEILDNTDVLLNADVLSSVADFDGAGSGWIRITAPDGSILNQSNVELIAKDGHAIASGTA